MNVTQINETLFRSPSFLTEGLVKLTPAQAGFILRECAYERQRRVDPIHADTLRELMRRGSWAPKDKLDFARFPDGRVVLVNGYHRMTAQEGSGVDITWIVAIHPVETVADVHRLYFKFDTNTRRRSAENIMQGVGFAEQHGLKKTTAKALYGAVPVIAAGLKASRGVQHQKGATDADFARRIVDIRLEISSTYVPAAKLLEEWMAPAPRALRRKLYNAGVFAVALVTTHHCPEQAEAFWRGVAENDGLRRGDPRATLITDMMTREMNNGSMNQAVFSPSRAWAAFAQGQKLMQIRCLAGARVKLIGTPYEVSA